MIKSIFNIIVILNLFALKVFAANIYAPDIIDSMIVALNPSSARGVMEQEIITSSKIVHRFIFEYFSEKNGSNILIRYIHPKKVVNNAFLSKNNGNDIWVYFPKNQRSRKLAEHSKMEKAHGSDFSYLDFSGPGQWKNGYRMKNIKSGEKRNYLLLLIPALKKEVRFDSLKVYINKLTYYPDRVLYYKNDMILKTLKYKEIIDIDGIKTAGLLNMKNHFDNSETNIRIIDMEYNIDFEKNIFHEINLKSKLK